ncbi:replication protein A 70 kDa DNA-binding subunit A [Senna tora]|uniref:Replication protein A subunit n=1 Tax=Senna tora TaxID=362788 RepID=A0A834WSB4_9FABA|nr:replication protein A 70 kDa DNA-binding subunit A [Senna tora]
MAVNLTEGAITIMCRDDFSSEDLKPVLQVIDLKLVQSQQHSATERYRLVLSDGTYYQQGMLATQKNELVNSGRLQKGSVVKLTQFICNVVQNRKIIIIIELDMVLDKCDLIGEPKQAPKPESATSSTGQPGATTATPQSLSRSSPAGGMPAQSNVAGPSLDHQKMTHTYSNAYSTGSDSAREPRATLPRSEPLGVSYGERNMGYRNPQPEASNSYARAPQPLPNSYARPPQPMYRQPSPVYSNRGPIARNEALPRIIPIAALNPYQNVWTIKARVTAKGDLRHYHNARGEGKVFSFDLLDSDGGEIRVTCFNSVADQFYQQIEFGKVYLISRGTVRPAQKNFNHLPNDQEVMLDVTSTVQPCLDDDKSIPMQMFNFRPINEVESLESSSIVDVIGVVYSISPTMSIMKKNGTETQKRALLMKDMSGCSVELTLWGNFCNAEGQKLQSICDSGAFPVLAVKAARVNEFNGKCVGTILTSQLFIEPDFPEAYRLKEWFDKEGKSTPTISISRESFSISKTDMRKTLSQIKDEKLGTSEKPDWITVCASVSFIRSDSFCYTACPIMIGDRKCNKKVSNNGDGRWRCDRCDQYVDACEYRYILQLQLQDHTGLTWVTAFQECGEEIMGVPAKDLHYMKYEEQDDKRFAQVVRKVLFTKYIFKLKVKEETFGDEQRVKPIAVKAEKVDFSSESRFLLALIDKFKADKIGVNPNTVMNNAGLRSVGTGLAVPQVYTPMKNNTNASREYGTPANQVGQQYGHQSLTSGGSSSSFMSCNNCGGSGHSSMLCPNIASVQRQSMGGAASANRATSGECFKCHQTGHWARDCPGISAAAPSAYGSSSVMQGHGVVQRQQLGGF